MLDVLNGAHPVWFPRNNGREPLMMYATAASALLFGPTALAAKVTAAAFGIATIPAMYLFGREVAAHAGEQAARRVGLLAAFLTATLYWHLNLSRIGLRTITLPLFLGLGLGLLLGALRRRNLVWAALAGLALGTATYTYTSVRLAPLVVAPFLALAVVRWRAPSVVALAVALWILVSAPFGIYYALHPQEVEGRASAVSVLNPAVGGGDPVWAAIRGAAVTAAATVWRGTDSGLDNLPGRPLFEPLTAVAFLVGLALALRALLRDAPIERPSAFLLLATLGVMALPSALAVNPPGFIRISGMIPAAVALAALGYVWIGRCLAPRVGRAWPAVVVLALAVPPVWTSYDYFVRWYGGGLAYRWVMEDKLQAADHVRRWLAGGERVFLAPLYAGDLTFAYQLRDTPPESFDVGAGLVVPASGVARYAFPPEDAAGLATVAERLGRTARFEMVADASGERPLLATLVLDPDPPRGLSGPTLASFEQGLQLVDARLDRERVRPGEHIELALTWRATAPVLRDYSVFVHGRLGSATRFQRDRMPAEGSLPTSHWRTGDVVGDYYRIELPRDLVPGEYSLVVGLYELASGQRLRIVDRPGTPNELEVTRFTAGG